MFALAFQREREGGREEGGREGTYLTSDHQASRNVGDADGAFGCVDVLPTRTLSSGGREGGREGRREGGRERE